MQSLKHTYILLFLTCFLHLSSSLAHIQTDATFENAENTGEIAFSLNGNWQFKTDPNTIGEEQQWFGPNFPANGWENMTVPGNWDVKNEYAHFSGKGWYRKTFEVPAQWQGKTMRLHFEAVYHDAKVWLNGQLLVESHSGFFPFEFDVSKVIKPGTINTVVVCADNTFRRGAIWNWGGIRRPVKLLVNNALRIEQAQVVATPDLAKGTAEVTVKVLLRNDSDQPKSVNSLAVIKNNNSIGKSANPDKKLTASLTIPANSSKEYTVKTTLPKSQTHLWHFDDPHLYKLEVTLNENGKLMHQIQDRFGIRKVEIEGLQLKLNGEPVRLLGYNWVPDDRTTGNTLPAWRYKQDIDLMKKAGANMARLSHLPLPKEVLDYIDEKGMLIYSEIPLWGQDALVDLDNPLPKEWLKTLVTTQFNHPSIIGWCVGNEIGFIHQNPKVMEYVQSAINYVNQELDNSRMAVYVSHSADVQVKDLTAPQAAGATKSKQAASTAPHPDAMDPAQYSTMVLFNKYGNLGKNADKVHQLHPGKPVFYSEYGYNLTSENLNLGVIDAKKMLNDIRGRDYLMGASLWTFNDYRSLWQAHAAWNTAPTGNRSWGIVNVFRQPKRAYEEFRREYAPIRSLSVGGMKEVKPGEKQTSTLTIHPRATLDLPAYTLRNYQLVWEVKDGQDNTVESNFVQLPTIQPGDQPLTQTINWTVPSSNPSHIKFSLLSPVNYHVYDTIIYLQKPAAPVVKKVIAGENGVRIVFEKNVTAPYYTVKYGINGFTRQSDTTINHYIDIKKLDKDQPYQFQVIGINHLGEGTPSQTITATPTTQLLPPVIWQAEAADSSFFIGYGYENYDYLYEIRYGLEQDTTKWKTLKVTTKGVCRIPNLQNGNTYQFQMRRIVQQYVTSGWSEVYEVTPDGNRPPRSPRITSIARKGSEAVIAFKPVEKATGYLVSYEEGGNEKQYTLSGMALDYIRLNGLQPDQTYTFRLSAINSNGKSESSQAVTIQAVAVK
ncbi:glycoside hydrolase family 2 TIM barrel-domain containing protein [Rhodocytophaga aerolata]|uniref:Glycoside hydrolase family 2 TIM barrel-domain containing protein n=1 Tax=Rhodocytophaga aerolata TaxID=455078 RepID=A0ABT8RBD5_9BACT|nr:sugar-binding domain-containing protein [Rhodocytophaga aerolata]MDO1449392.1 glycoside hydrolase family 2 TIM barrel-domain containing protein [Rhodocytophaga aerolata]